MTWVGPSIDRWMPRSLLVRRGASSRRAVALTFDDGPDGQTLEYLDLLDRLSVKATFFMIGQQGERRAAEMAEVARRGHELASHGYTHRALTHLSRREILDELSKTKAILPSPTRLVRPPFGAISLRSFAHMLSCGYTTVLWSLDSDDCRTDRPESVIDRLHPSRIKPGEIILLHEGQKWTLEALPTVVQALKEDGYSLVTVSDLLGR